MFYILFFISLFVCSYQHAMDKIGNAQAQSILVASIIKKLSAAQESTLTALEKHEEANKNKITQCENELKKLENHKKDIEIQMSRLINEISENNTVVELKIDFKCPIGCLSHEGVSVNFERAKKLSEELLTLKISAKQNQTSSSSSSSSSSAAEDSDSEKED